MKIVRILLAMGLVAAAASASPVLSQSTATARYDAQGRLMCVGRTTPLGMRYTRYDYDTAGNRTIVATNSTVCSASEVGSPPTATGMISVTNPSVTLNSQAQDVKSWSVLGSASDGSALLILSAVSRGTSGSCGVLSVHGGWLTFTAPVVSGSAITCYVDYTLRHSSGNQRGGRITYTINPLQSGGGGLEDPGGGECPPGQTPPCI